MSILFQHFASTTDDIMGLLGPSPKEIPKEKSGWQPETDEERAERIRRHKEWQASRPGLNPGDDISQHQMGKDYPTAEWVPIEVAQRFRDHTGDQHKGSTDIVDDLHAQLKSGRGATDPLMLLHHNEARVAHLGEGNHRLTAMERAGWTHVPMRVTRMYDSEAKDYVHQPNKHIPVEWMGSHVGQTPDTARPSEVFSFGSTEHPKRRWVDPRSFPKSGSTAYSGEHEQGSGGEAGPGVDHSGGRRGGTLALLRWVAGGKSRRRDRRERERAGESGPEQSDAPGVEAPEPRPVTWHPKAAKEFKALHPQDRKQILDRIEQLRVSDPVALNQSHPLYGDMKGWTSTKASRGHRVVHQDRDGTMHIVYAGLHYESVDMPSRTSAVDHDVLYHLTDSPTFKPDPEHEPTDNTFALQDRSGRKGLYVGDKRATEHWWSPAGEGYTRPYVAELHVPKGIAQPGRWGNEQFIPSEHPDKVKVHRVMHWDDHMREQYSDHGHIESFHGTEHDTGNPIGKWRPNKFPGYQAPDMREASPEVHAQHRERWKGYMKGEHGWTDEDFNPHTASMLDSLEWVGH